MKKTNLKRSNGFYVLPESRPHPMNPPGTKRDAISIAPGGARDSEGHYKYSSRGNEGTRDAKNMALEGARGGEGR